MHMDVNWHTQGTELTKPGQLQPVPAGRAQLPLGSAWEPCCTGKPPGCAKGHLPQVHSPAWPLRHFSTGSFTYLQHWIKHPSAPGSLLGQEVGAHQAQLLVSGLQAVWSSTSAKSTTGPLRAEEKEHGTGTLLEAVLETADSSFSWQFQHER